jgi:hypothetical protein
LKIKGTRMGVEWGKSERGKEGRKDRRKARQVGS